MSQPHLGYEEIFLAIAVKNRMVTPEAAKQCLASFRALAGTAKERPIQQIAVETGLLTGDQAKALSAAAIRKLSGEGATPPCTKSTIRVAAGLSESAPPPKAPPFDPKNPFPGYQIKDKLGVGGTATVFRATERRPPYRDIALKVLLPTRARDEKYVTQFRREAELLISFDHPGIVKGYEFGRAEAPGFPMVFFAMELVPGMTVQEELDRNGALPEERALETILQAAKALEYMQGKGLVHRDIKPGNLMRTKEGAVKLLDLGFAISIGSDAGGALEEAEGTTSGTVQYMSPEQAQGARDLDVRSDIYSLGATLYHMVMGDVPFKGTDSLEVMAKQVLEALSAEIKNRGISRHMHYFIERMMSKDKNYRYADAAELIQDINEQVQGAKSLEFDPNSVPESDVMKGLRGSSPPPASRKTDKFHITTRRTDRLHKRLRHLR